MSLTRSRMGRKSSKVIRVSASTGEGGGVRERRGVALQGSASVLHRSFAHVLSESTSAWIFFTSSSEGFCPSARSTVPRSPTRILLSPFLSKSEKASRNSCVCSALKPWGGRVGGWGVGVKVRPSRVTAGEARGAVSGSSRKRRKSESHQEESSAVEERRG